MAKADKPTKLYHQIFKRVHRHTKHFLVPHQHNNHHPHALRPAALRLYAVAIIAVKLFVTGFLFLSSPSPAEFATIATSEILNLTNASRTAAGVAPLSLSSTLNQAALLKAQHMLENNYFAHTAPDGTKPWYFIKTAGYSYSAAGENLAMDFTEASTVHTAFMNSPSHEKNIMNPKYTEMGIAIIDGQLQGSNTTILVEFFGTPYQTAVAEPEPTPEPAPAPAPAPTPEPTPEPAPAPAQPLFYRAELTDQSAEELGIKTLEKIEFWVDFKNTGTATWTNDGKYFVALNVTNPIGRYSEFEDETWAEYYRPAILTQSRVLPGEIGRFEFMLNAPDEAGVYEESYGLVAENKTWIDGGSIELPIVVVAPPEQTTEQEVEVIQTPLSTTPTNTNQTPPLVEEVPLANENLTIKTTAENHPQVIVMAERTGEEAEGFVGKIIEYSQRFYIFFVIFLGFALLINILVEIRVQHPHVIAQTIIVIVIAASAIFLHPHFLEQVPKALKII